MTTPERAAALLALAALLGCGDDGSATAAVAASPAEPIDCPEGLAPDAARAQRVYDHLRSVPEGTDTLAALDGIEPPICFGEADPSVVTSGGVLWLDGRMDEPEAAARVAHLLHHLAAMPDLDHPGSLEACEGLVAEAMRVEQRSVELEEHLRRELGVADPITEPRTEGLEEAYRRRCEQAAR